MTAVRGAGYTSNRVGSGSSQMFDPLNQAANGPAPPLEGKKEDTCVFFNFSAQRAQKLSHESNIDNINLICFIGLKKKSRRQKGALWN